MNLLRDRLKWAVLGFFAFSHSLVSSAAIPVAHIKGIDELFKHENKLYSPLVGLMYHRDFIDNLYHFGIDESAPIVPLKNTLFTEVPGGEVTPSHQPKNPAAHLSGAAIAKIFLEFEKIKAEKLDVSELGSKLGARIVAIMTSDNEYKKSLAKAEENRVKAKADFLEFESKYKELQAQAAEVEKSMKEEITPLDRQIKKLRDAIRSKEDSVLEDLIKAMRKDLEAIGLDRGNLNRLLGKLKNAVKSEGPDRAEKISAEQSSLILEVEKFAARSEILIELNKKMDQLKSTDKTLTGKAAIELNVLKVQLADAETKRTALTDDIQKKRANLISSEQRKLEERKMNYKLDFNDTTSESYRKSLEDFGNKVAGSFVHYELGSHSQPYFQYATTISLLSYMWLKYTQRPDLRGYLEAMADAGALDEALWKKVDEAFYRDIYRENDFVRLKKRFLKAWLKDRWIRKHFADAVALSLESPSEVKIPQVVSFGYFKWMKYSWDPDCCENALHNLFNLITFNPKTGYFDEQILAKLKETYPELSEKLIEYYHNFKTFDQHDLPDAAAAWIQVVSGLNDGIDSKDKDQLIHYRKERSIVASPYPNLVKVVNRLFGFQDVNTDHMTEIFKRVKEISGFEVDYMRTGIDSQGFGTAEFKVGKDKFLLEAYRPIHVGFFLEKDTSDKVLAQIGQTFFDKNARNKKDPVKKFRYNSGLNLFLTRGVLKKDRYGTDPNARLLFTHYKDDKDKLEVIAATEKAKNPVMCSLLQGLAKSMKTEDVKQLPLSEHCSTRSK